MKILHVLDHSIPLHSGYTFRTRSILLQQRALGWHTEHLTSGKQGEVSDLVEEIEGFKFYRTPAGQSWIDRLPLVGQMLIVWRLYKRLNQLLDELKPDVVHAHSPALNGLAAYWATQRKKIPLVYECRAFWEDAAVDNGSSRAGGIRYRLTRALETFVFRRASAVTTICQGLKRDVIERGIEASKITVIPNAVDVEKFSRSESSEKSSDEFGGEVLEGLRASCTDLECRTLLGFFGSFYEYEGLSLLLEGIKLLKQRGVPVLLVLAGGGPKESVIQEKIKRLELADCVVCTGRVPHEVIQDYYQLMDIMVYPRLSMRLTELVTPLKPLEAMAKGKIVIASGVGGHQELIADGETGLLFDAGNAEALADTIETAVNNKSQWPRIQTKARAFVEEDRNWARSVSFYRQAYGYACDH